MQRPSLRNPYHYNTAFCTIRGYSESTSSGAPIACELDGKFHSHTPYHNLPFSKAIATDFNRARIKTRCTAIGVIADTFFDVYFAVASEFEPA